MYTEDQKRILEHVIDPLRRFLGADPEWWCDFVEDPNCKRTVNAHVNIESKKKHDMGLSVWVKTFKIYKTQELRNATFELMQTYKYKAFPKPAFVKEICDSNRPSASSFTPKPEKFDPIPKKEKEARQMAEDYLSKNDSDEVRYAAAITYANAVCKDTPKPAIVEQLASSPIDCLAGIELRGLWKNFHQELVNQNGEA